MDRGNALNLISATYEEVNVMMTTLRGNRKGQSIVEYAVLLAIVISVIIGMQFYVKRAMQGRHREVADQSFGRQFEPTDGTYSTTRTVTQAGSSDLQAIGASSSTDTQNDSGEVISDSVGAFAAGQSLF